MSGVFHYLQSVHRFSSKLPTTKEQEKFDLLSITLQEAVTQTNYYETYEQLMRFITKKKDREQLLLNWFDWWHKRCAKFSTLLNQFTVHREQIGLKHSTILGLILRQSTLVLLMQRTMT